MRRQFNLPLRTELQQSYNIAAGQNAYVLTNQSPELQVFRFGLIANWAKDEQSGLNLINAMAEGIETRLSFRMPIRQHRCLVFADSYYEWKRTGREAQPYRVLYPDSSIMAMAGVWDVWLNPANQREYKSFSIVTVPANQEVSAIAARMPLLLRTPDDWVRWLADTPLPEVLSMLVTPPNGILQLHPVSKDVDDPNNNYPDLHEVVK